jgi:hypothetical protein
MNTKVFRGLRIRHAAFPDQANRLKLELSRIANIDDSNTKVFPMVI